MVPFRMGGNVLSHARGVSGGHQEGFPHGKGDRDWQELPREGWNPHPGGVQGIPGWAGDEVGIGHISDSMAFSNL